MGALIDHNKGTAYTYPTWIRLVFGQVHVFDRKDEKEGFVQIGKLPGANGAPVAAGVARPQRATSPPPAMAARLATGYAPVDDIDAVPYLGSRGREAYREWLSKKMPRAFAVAVDGSFGRGWGYSTIAERPELSADPTQRAMQVCEAKTRSPCRLYAVNGAVVWAKHAALVPDPSRLPTPTTVNPVAEKTSASSDGLARP